LDLTKPTIGKDAHTWIETVKVECLNRYGNRAGSMRAVIADRIAAGWSDSSIYGLLGKSYGEERSGISYMRKIEFSANLNGRRVPKPIADQHNEMAKLISQLRFEMRQKGTEISQSQTEDEVSTDTEETEDSTEEVSEETETVKSTVHPFLAKIREIRAQETIRSETEGKRTPILESVSGNRPAKNGARMLSQGIPTEAILHALALDWPSEARSRYGIRDYDVSTFTNGAVPANRHPAYAYFDKAAKARVPIALIGPSGTGKSTLCKQWADDQGMSFGFVPMTAGATPSWLVGAYTLEGYRTRSAMECYQNGGVFVFEEMDAADPNMLLVANNLIENEVFDNPVTGEQFTRHPDFIPVACMNTRGLGATATNTGRSRLDDATRNRFAIGRMELFLSEEIEEFIFNSNLTAE
jgi:TolA-binding protein